MSKQSLSVEELLKDRYKVIAPYPRHLSDGVDIGDILTDDGVTPVRNQHGKAIIPFDWELFPNIFRKLEWHEERKSEDMPEYVKIGYGGGAWKGKIGKAKFSSINTNVDVFFSDADEHQFHRSDVIPATASEYNHFISQYKK